MLIQIFSPRWFLSYLSIFFIWSVQGMNYLWNLSQLILKTTEIVTLNVLGQFWTVSIFLDISDVNIDIFSTLILGNSLLFLFHLSKDWTVSSESEIVTLNVLRQFWIVSIFLEILDVNIDIFLNADFWQISKKNFLICPRNELSNLLQMILQ